LSCRFERHHTLGASGSDGIISGTERSPSIDLEEKKCDDEHQRVDGDQNGVHVEVDRFSRNANADGLNAAGIVKVEP
jgi:hypothetical protein